MAAEVFFFARPEAEDSASTIYNSLAPDSCTVGCYSQNCSRRPAMISIAPAAAPPISVASVPDTPDCCVVVSILLAPIGAILFPLLGLPARRKFILWHTNISYVPAISTSLLYNSCHSLKLLC